MSQVNDVSGGLLIGTQGGSVYIDARAAGLAPAREGAATDEQEGTRVPLEGEIATLAEAAAVALVTAMGTSGWTGIRDSVTRLFQRAGTKRHDRVAGRLDDDASLVSSAADQAETRAVVQPFWQLTFRELLNTAPDCAASLAEIVRAQSARPDGGTHMEQHTTVRDFGRAFVAQGGNVIVHGDGPVPPGPGRPSGGAPGATTA
jgi:hypothetical protein